MHAVSTSEASADETPMLASSPSSRQTALLVVGQAALMGFGALLALIIAQSFGKSAKTDAFFAAYGLYSVGQVFGSTFRLTAVSPLVRATGPQVATRLLGAVALLCLGVALPMIVLAGPVGHLLVDQDPTGVAATSLRILWVALAGQLIGAMLATLLTVRGSFTALGLITLVTGLVTTATFLLTRHALGIDAAPVGLAAGGLWISGASLAVLWRSGWRPSALTPDLLRGTLGEARRLGYASTTFIGTNLAYVVTLAIVARIGPGEATLYSYAFVLTVVLVSLTANVSAMVRSPSLVASEHRTSETEAVGRWSLRMTIAVGGPALGFAVLLGPPLIGSALGSGFSDRDVRSILVLLPCLGGWALASAAGIFAVVELLAREELRRLAVLAVAQLVGVLLLGIAGSAIAGMAGVAVALSVVALAVTFTQQRWAFGERIVASARRFGWDAAKEAGVLVCSFGPSALMLWLLDASAVGYVLAAGLAIVLVIPLSARLWPSEVGSLSTVFRRR